MIARRIWQNCLVGGKADFERIRRTVGLLSKARRRNTIEVFAAFKQRLLLYLNERSLTVSSATSLSEAEKASILGAVCGKEEFPGGICFEEDPTIIAGLQVRKGYDLLDYSLKSHIETIRATLKSK